MEKVLIALPVYKREWILPTFLKCIENQNYPLDHLGFMFELGPDDPETHNILLEWGDKHPEFFMFEGQIEITKRHFQHAEGERAWNLSRYENMAIFRNSLLTRATEKQDQFDIYFSLDSDLLLEDPNTILRLVETLVQNDLDTLSPLCFMTPTSRSFPNCMYWESAPGGMAKRDLSKFKEDSLQECDIIMAAVMMSKRVFTKAKYYVHPLGEDIGFATDLARHGFKSYLDSRIYVPHMLHRYMLDNYLKTGIDPRNPVKLL